MKFLRRSILFFLILTLTILPLTGCGSVNDNAVIYYEATIAAGTLDPQLASNDTELLMIRNLFEGLMRVDENGEVVTAVATDYTFEDNIYTFKLSENSYWIDGTPVTAYDFEFAFKRAVDPKTRSPYAGKLRSVLNAELILEGQIEPEQLGVKAKDSTTLVITLSSNDSNFL